MKGFKAMDYTQELKEYKHNLFDKEIGKPAREYLKKRNVTPKTAIAWNLGYCPMDYMPECYSKTEYPFPVPKLYIFTPVSFLILSKAFK